MSANLARAALLGAGVLAAHELSSRAWGAPPADPRPVETKAEAPARSRLGLPCGARSEDELGATFALEWARQNAALGATYGAFLGRPNLSAACCVEWATQWLRSFGLAHQEDHYRFRVFASGNDQPESAIDPMQRYPEAQAVLGGGFLGKLERSELGNAWWALVGQRDRALAAASKGSGLYVHSRATGEAIRQLAIALDNAARAGGRPDPAVVKGLKELPGLAKDVAKGAGGAVAWAIEEIAAPIVGAAAGATIGAVTSAAAPYLILGGVVYFVWGRR